MKFHCDRCQTRYSIADERVRGKILKIRCKNCSAVITVKEGAEAPEPAPRAPVAKPAAAKPAVAKPAVAKPAVTAKAGGSALMGAFEAAMGKREPDAGDSLAAAPSSFVAEWYVSLDGDQFGPFTLEKAQDWVSSKAPGDDLHCWSEGFDDWLPVEKVSHFRGLRTSASIATRGAPRAFDEPESEATVVEQSPAVPAGRPALPLPKPEDTPKPLFARTLAQMAAEAPSQGDPRRAEPGRKNGNGAPASGRPGERPGMPLAAKTTGGFEPIPASELDDIDEAENELAIGEASRVVNIAMLAPRVEAQKRQTQAMQAIQLPGLGRGTGGQDSLGRTGPVPVLPYIATGTVDLPRPEIMQPRSRRRRLLLPIAIASVLVLVAVVLLVVLASGPADDGGRIARGHGADENLGYQFDENGKRIVAPVDPAGDKGKGGRNGGGGHKTPHPGGTAIGILPTGDGETDLTDRAGDAPRPLDGDDLLHVQQANQVGMTICYNRALKHDPLLKVGKVQVAIAVGLTGGVQSVSIPSLSGTELGSCLEAFIHKWKFPRTTEVFNGQFPVVFDSR